MLWLTAFSAIVLTATGRRFSTLLKSASSLHRNALSADPYEWELQVNPLSKNSCYSLPEDTLGNKVFSVRDTSCVGFAKAGTKCHGGFPFFRFTTGQPECVDCMDAGRCQMMCLSKGMDAAAVLLDSVTRNPTECRCGATRKNMAVWRILGSDNQVNFGPVHGLLPVTVKSALSTQDPRCRMFVYTYDDVRESDGGIPRQFLDVSLDDDRYIRAIVSGLEDPGDVEDSTVAEGERVHLAIRRRLELWEKSQTSSVSDEMFVEQVAEEIRKSKSSSNCESIDEPTTCWGNAVSSVLAANQITQVTADQSAYTPEYSNLMMTVTFANWQNLFRSTSKPAGLSYTGSGFCANSANAGQCPITCGACELFDRPAGAAAMYNTWLGNKDATTGQVRIPVVFDTANQYITEGVKNMVLNATAIVNSASCVNFTIIDRATISSNQKYVLITALTDSTGKPSGCLADPVGLPDTQATSVNVGGCSENRNPLGSLVHELLHVLGMVHTQMRPDRDEFIQMNPAMVKDPFQVNFFLAPYAFDGAEGKYSAYDYGSIMHYTRTQAAEASKYNANSADFSGTFKLLGSLPTGVTIGQRNAMSALDIAEINMLYQCGKAVGDSAMDTARSTVAPTSTPTTYTPPRSSVPMTSSIPGSATSTSEPTSTPTTYTPARPTGPITTTIPGTNTPWRGWESDLAKYTAAVTAILDNEDISLSVSQSRALETLLSANGTITRVFSQAVASGELSAGWDRIFSTIASEAQKIIAESKAGINSFDQGLNPLQTGILDDQAIDQLQTVIETAKALHEKLDSFAETLVPKNSLLLRQQRPRNVVVFGNTQ